jgi:hypothetical protein
MSKYVSWYGFKRNVNSFAKLKPSEREEAERILAANKAERRDEAAKLPVRVSEFERKTDVVLNPIKL